MTADRRPRRSSKELCEHILATAHELFYANGIRATGIDAIVAAAGIGPTSLYRLFASKDELIAAYVMREAEGYRAWVRGRFEEGGPDPRAQLDLFMASVADQVEGSNCRGCPFQLTLAEFPSPAHPAHVAARELKGWVRDQLRDLAARAGAKDADRVGDELMLLSEGAYAAASSLGSAAISERARRAALALLPASKVP